MDAGIKKREKNWLKNYLKIESSYKMLLLVSFRRAGAHCRYGAPKAHVVTCPL